MTPNYSLHTSVPDCSLPSTRPPGLFLRIVLTGTLLAMGCQGGGSESPPPEVWDAGDALVPATRIAAYDDDGDAAGLRLALDRAIEMLDQKGETLLTFGPDQVSAAALSSQLRQVETLIENGLNGSDLVRELLQRFRLYESAAGPEGVLVTGYYEALLQGSRSRGGSFQYPLYARPSELVDVDLGAFRPALAGQRISGLLEGSHLVPFHERAAIEAGALDGRELELVFVDDPLDAFFLHVQGSGRVALEDGSSMRVHYAGANGHPYRSIGRLLIDEGAIPREKMSMQALRRHLTVHSSDRDRVLQYNPSYVFFREETDGPYGSTGAIVTAGRSIATDRNLFPPGALAFLVTTRPVVDQQGERIGSEPLLRLVLNLDSGGAIRGPGRVDLFCGFGDEAESMAGQLKDQGSLYFFSPLSPR